MKLFAWITGAVGVACTAMFVLDGLAGDGALAWVNGWMIGPIILVFMAPTLFSIGDRLGGDLTSFGGGIPKAFHGAPIALGTVVSTSRTGLSINDQPQLDIVLDVETPEGRSFRGVARQIVDLTELAAVRAGAVLPVRYLPDSTDGTVVLATDGSEEELQSALNRIQVANGSMTPRQLEIAEHGVDAQAVVLAMAPTGEIRGDRSVMNLTLRETRPDGSTFDLAQEKAVPPASVPQVQPGMVVRVKYLAGDESEVSVVTSLVP